MIKRGDKVRLNETIKSVTRGTRLYGEAREVVKVISAAHYPVLLLVGKKEAFPASVSQVTKI